jgi:hypothetical protein
MIKDNFNGWPIVKSIPEGWSVDKTTGSPLSGHVFITNGKSVLNGQERSLLQVSKGIVSGASQKQMSSNKVDEVAFKSDLTSYDQQVRDAGFRKTVNDMARERFKLNLLKDIMCDLTICEIEGWDKADYIKQIKKMINHIGKGVTLNGMHQEIL